MKMFADGDCGQRRRWEKLNDSAILQGDLHERLQENNRGGLFRETNRVIFYDLISFRFRRQRDDRMRWSINYKGNGVKFSC